MNYQHAYHAGNFADVVKHTLLVELLERYQAKQKCFYALDAYAGRGLYSLGDTPAQKTGEHLQGVTRLLSANHDSAPFAVRRYIEHISNAKKIYDKYVYAGSPWILAQYADDSARVVRRQKRRSRTDFAPDADIFDVISEKAQSDTPKFCRAEAFEKNANEYDALYYQLYRLPIGIHHRDAFEGVLGVIPPPERRGLVFLDPPFEREYKDFSAFVDLIVKVAQKWQNSTVALWYPIKNLDAVATFYNKMRRTGLDGQWIGELCLYPTDIAVGLMGTGFYVLNPPYGFDKSAHQILSYLKSALKIDNIEPTMQAKWLAPAK